MDEADYIREAIAYLLRVQRDRIEKPLRLQTDEACKYVQYLIDHIDPQ